MATSPEHRRVAFSLRGTGSMVTRQMVVPYGYTLTVGGTLAIMLERHSRPGPFAIWLFVVGAVGGVMLAGALTKVRAAAIVSPAAEGPLFNASPVAVVPLVVLATWWIPTPIVAFPLAGMGCSVAYVAVVALLFRRVYGLA